MKKTIITVLLVIAALIVGVGLGYQFPFGEKSVENKLFHQVIGSPKSVADSTGKKPKNIIFMVGDGMGVSQIYAGLTANKGSLNLEAFKHIGFCKTNSGSDYITDSAAGATAFSIGKKTYNGAIGVDADTIPRETILETAARYGLSTGLVSTSQITHATPASFIAHQPSRHMYEDIAADFLKTDIEVFIGGGKDDFVDREDGKDLTADLKAKGYEVCFDIDAVEKSESGRLAGLLAPVGMPKVMESRGDMLVKSSEKAISILQQEEKGFFLMIEGSQIDWGGHANDAEYVITEMLDFDKTIGEVLKWAEQDGETLVVVTSDHETGGLSIDGGNIEEGKVEANFSSTHHTSVMVPVFAYGPGAEEFMGIYHNTEIYGKFMSLYGFDKEAVSLK